MAYPVSDKYMKALLSPNKVFYVKIEIFESDGTFIKELTHEVSQNDLGGVSANLNSPVRRHFSFSLKNTRGEYTWGEDNLIWIDKRIKLYTGLKLFDGTVEYVPQGVFIVSEPEDSHDFNGNMATMQGKDKMWLMTDKRGTFVFETTIETGVNVGTALRLIAARASETMYNFDPITETVPFDLPYTPSDSLYKALEDLSFHAKGTIGYDVNGYLTFKKIDLNDFSTQAVVWTFDATNPRESFYAGNIRRMDEEILANDIYVLGGSGQTAIASYRLTVDENDPLWADSPYSIQKIGRITYFHQNGSPDPLLTTTEECLWRSKYELKRRLGYSERVTLQTSPIWHLEVGDVIEIIDPANGVEGKYIIESFTLPLSPQLMTIECRKERRVIENWDFI